MRRLVTALLVLVASACRPPLAPPPVPPATGAHPPGAHDATSRHDFADVNHWRNVFDDPSRDAWQKPVEVVAALDLAPGSVVADLGAGTGYFSRHLSAAVGPTGTVLAVDPEPNLVTHLRSRAEGERTPNVVPILASRDNPRLPLGGVDVILVVDTYHHIDDRVGYFAAARRYLRRGGRIAVIDWQKYDLPVGPPADHKLAREQVIEEMTEAGYEVDRDYGVLPYQYFVVFRPR
jgi:ubiquinone/menaquinone biosynthesis C-methylase UbiE